MKVDLSGPPTTWPEFAQINFDERVDIMAAEPDVDQTQVTAMAVKSIRDWWDLCQK